MKGFKAPGEMLAITKLDSGRRDSPALQRVDHPRHPVPFVLQLNRDLAQIYLCSVPR